MREVLGSRSVCMLALLFTTFVCCGSNAFAQKYKPLPPAGIELTSEQESKLAGRVSQLGKRIDQLSKVAADPDSWRADVVVFLRAVELALEQQLFFKPSQVSDAGRLLDEAERRLDAVADGIRGIELLGFQESNTNQPQMLVGGFVSRIDDSVQPYGLVVPAGYQLDDRKQRLDVWLHGRGDSKTEIPFLTERMNKPGQYTPKNTFVLHPFGRHCNAFKFAGETDVYEAIDHAKRLISVDSNRVSIRGFSMGGAACWHFAVHDPARWFAANPGAGFVDTLVYQGWGENPPFKLTPSRRALLNWYDVLPWVGNLRGTNVIAYSGEKDKQKQAADRVVEEASRLGLRFPYVIGKDMGHKIDKDSQVLVDEQIDRWANDIASRPATSIEFKTYSLRYPQANWLRINGMREHWSAASVSATLDLKQERIEIDTDDVTHLEIDFSRSGWPNRNGPVDIHIDGQTYSVEDSGNRPGFQASLATTGSGEWALYRESDDSVRKRPGLQGPIDDAFCERFIIVLPSRPARHGRIQRWLDAETDYLKERWRRLMRGDVRVVLDRELTDDDIATCHLICFGDFSSNRYLASVASSLPFEWTRETIRLGGREYDAAKHAAVFCYPNPLNPRHYLVVNSGLTFREFSNNSNSRQIAMLPDWAVLDVTGQDKDIFAGDIVDEGFFDENWKTKPDDLLPR